MHLLESHFPGCIISDGNNMSAEQIIGDGAVNNSLINEIITEERIVWAINSFAPYKSPGEDGIFPALLQHYMPLLINHIKRIFVASLTLKYTPKNWRGVKVVFIPKSGNHDYSKANSFRPLSLTSFLLKTMEKLIDRYIRDGPLTS